MPALEPAVNEFQCIKGAKLIDGILSGPGFALADYQYLNQQDIEYTISTTNPDPLTFLFGLQGIGNHFRVDICPQKRRIVLSRIRDGISVYLQHAYLDLEIEPSLSIRWNRSSIRLYSGAACFMNVLAEDLAEGRWGFVGTQQPIQLPDVMVHIRPESSYEWIILGDGYSNNRWSNRDFFSWPELAFGDKTDYLNACVAAGNTRRVLEIVNKIGRNFSGSRVIVASGADDVIEGEPLEEIIERLQQIIKRVREMGASEVHLTTIVPQIKHYEQTLALNREISRALSGTCDSILDFHHLLGENLAAWSANGDFPGAIYQRKIAVHVLEHFFGHGRLAPLVDPSPRPQLRGLRGRVIALLSRWLDRSLGRF